MAWFFYFFFLLLFFFFFFFFFFHYLFLMSPSFDASGRLYFVIVTFPGYLQLYFCEHIKIYLFHFIGERIISF